MSFSNKTFDDISMQDIQTLVENGVHENQNLEYKKVMWDLDESIGGGHDEKKREMLKDISAMANRNGGYFIIGIEEGGDGQALKIHNVVDAENQRDRLLSSLLTNISPRIPGIQIKCVGTEEEKTLILHVPNSFRKPHMITFGGYNQFWARHDRQKSPMSIDEIEDAVINTVNITKNTETFFSERKKEILSEIDDLPAMVMGVYPVGAEKEIVDVADPQLREFLKRPPRARSDGVNFVFNYCSPQPSYYGLSVGEGDLRKVDLHRNGYLEGRVMVSSFVEKETNTMTNWAIVEYLYCFIKEVKQIYAHLGFDGQTLIYFSFYNIFGYCLKKKLSTWNIPGELGVWHKSNLEIKPITFMGLDEVKVTKIIADRIWQSFGFDNEPFIVDGELKIG